MKFIFIFVSHKEKISNLVTRISRAGGTEGYLFNKCSIARDYADICIFSTHQSPNISSDRLVTCQLYAVHGFIIRVFQHFRIQLSLQKAVSVAVRSVEYPFYDVCTIIVK